MRVYDPTRLGHSGFYIEHAAAKGIDFVSTTAPHPDRDARARLHANGYLYLANYYAVT